MNKANPVENVSADGSSLTHSPVPVRSTRPYRRLQSTVHRYLDDSGEWIEDVDRVLKDLMRMIKETEAARRQLDRRERAIRRREAIVDRWLQEQLPEGN